MQPSSHIVSLPAPSRSFLLILVVLLVGLGASAYWVARPLVRSLPAEPIPGAPEVTATWLPDAANRGSLSITDAVALDKSGAFVAMPPPETVPVLNARYLDARWFCFRIQSRLSRHDKVVLDLVWQNYDRATLYQQRADGGWDERNAGEMVRPGDPTRSSRLMAFDLLLPPDRATTVYLRVQDFTRLPAQFQFWPRQSDFLRWERFEFAKRVGMLCLLVAMLAYGLFSYAMLYQRDQLHYVWIVLLNAVSQVLSPALGGLVIWVPGSPVREMVFGAIGGMIILCFCWFTQRFFNLAKEDPKGNRWVVYAQWVLFSAVVLAALPLWPGTAFVNLMTVMTLFTGVLMLLLGIGIRRWRSGVPQAPLFVLALVLIIFGRLQFLIKGPDVVVRYDEQVLISMLCNGASLLLLALAAAYRHRLVMEEHLALRASYTHRLENDVAERTRVLQDLSERLKATVAERDRVLAIVGHDLRGPTMALQSLTHILAEDATTFTPDQLADLSREIDQACSLQLELLNSLLVWGGVQSGHGRKAHPVDVREAAEAAWKPLAAFAVGKNIMLVDACPKDLRVMADASLLQTILRNLLANAIKFTRPAGRIEIGGRLLSSGVVELSVRDDGVGIEPGRLQTLFDGAVESLPGTNAEKGTGLGLSLCRDLVRAVGGDIRLESEAGRGTLALVTLPAVLADSSRA